MEANSSNFHLPLHISSEILSYLPVKSLLRFRSVSKDWKSVIDNPDFASLHFSHYPNNGLESQLFVLENPTGGGELRARSCRHGTYKAEFNPQTSEFDIPIPCSIVSCLTGPLWPLILGDVNGLLLLQLYRLNEVDIKGDIFIHEIFLWNPSIRKTLNIPLPSFTTEISVLFFGFDPSTNDYKVVLISPPNDEHQQPDYTFDIFSLKSLSWRRGNFSASGGKTSLLNSVGPRNVSSGGSSVHWIVYNCYSDESNLEFATFNMISETFSFTLLPKFDGQKFDKPVLVTGFLVGFLVKCGDFVEIWVLNKDDCSWSKRYRFGISPMVFNISQCPCFFAGAFIWRFSDSEDLQSAICFYDTRIRTKSVPDNSLWSSFYIGTYMESLVLLA